MMREKVLGKSHPSTAVSYNNIGIIYDKIGKKEKALIELEKALTIFKITLGNSHSYTKNVQESIELIKKEIAKQK